MSGVGDVETALGWIGLLVRDVHVGWLVEWMDFFGCMVEANVIY